MNWTNGAESMAKAWTEAQNTMWKNWYDWVQTAPATPRFDQGLVDQWQKLANQGLEAWLANAEPTAKGVAQRLFASQEALMRFLKFASEAWQAIAAKVESGEAWEKALAETMDQVREEFIHLPERMFKAGQDSNELWRLYLDQVQKLSQPWATSFQRASGHVEAATAGDGSALLELSHLYWDTYERTLGRIAESPSLGYTRELDEKIRNGFEAWQDFQQVSFEYHLLLAEAWVRVFEKLMHVLMALAEKGEAIHSLRELVDLWNTVADEVFIEAFRTEDYIRVQGRLVNAGMAYRLRQREIIEIFMQISDLPTRSEVDEAHYTIYRQGKEIKALKKTVAELTGSKQAYDAVRAEQEQTRQTIMALQADVKTLQKTVAELSGPAKPASPPGGGRRASGSGKSSTGRKRAARPTTTEADQTEQGG
jgi:class III poly(R)-hydroxyalkanoic acid synthase PhaE subunit